MALLNKNNSAIKRIMQEARELANDPSTDYCAAPLEDDIFEWHCTMRGPPDTEFEGGIYHFKITLPSEYPFRPPSIVMLTPNGRFELNTKICISFTNYHEELWQPAWGVRTAIIGLQGFFPLKGTSAQGLGAVEYPPSERKRLAKLSREWTCPQCQQRNVDLLPDASPDIVVPSTDGTPSLHSHPESAQTGADSANVTSSPIAPAADPPIAIHSVAVPLAPGSAQSASGLPDPAMQVAMLNRATVESTPVAQAVPVADAVRQRRAAQRSRRPPLLLDTLICVLLAMVVGLIYRRMY
ncbi:ubiquitin-conjugating enzyme/RWD-like protein [Schizophyllum amplum]|uniref:Ubiquitin-conjugating enzyme/RWD-like protein n=1 Tax=Schizophyllum amplum TaxID=97359 RepID=A0A550CAB4_9AGAR|nr:ubiquitin-conjugating enzyme/RWD-like protein [Auriculariopsis ampla]